jgi:large subunit ribosomal protein L4
MSKANVYSAKGVKTTPYSLPQAFGEKENLNLLAQSLRVYEDRLHPGLAKAKTRAEVERTKKKWYRQKGTGGARHGARSAPIFVGGGVTHGPRGIKRVLELPSKMKKRALNVALSLKAKEGQVILVDKISTLTKTADVQNLLNKILRNEAKDKKVLRITFILSPDSWAVSRLIENINDVKVLPFASLSSYNVFYGGVLIFDKDIFVKKAPKTKKK